MKTMSATSPVVFEQGVRTYRFANVDVQVIVPRNITLEEIRPGLERMVLDASQKRECAPQLAGGTRKRA